MNLREYTKDGLEFKNFECPHCGVLSQMRTSHMGVDERRTIDGWNSQFEHLLSVATCQSCGNSSLWWDGECVYPDALFTAPNKDMPESVKSLYLEASAIYDKSPRAACALLRLAVERLCEDLGESGTIDTMIGNLVRKGLPTMVQKALDAVRVIGNKAVHPGSISFDVDDKTTAETLMRLLNIITERMITEPKEIDDIFEALPETIKQSILKRDS